MRTADDPKWSVALIHSVNVNSKRDHGVSNRLGWLDVKLSVLDRPKPKARDFDPLDDRDRPILMPAERPIRFVGFVEQECTHCERSVVEKLRGNRANRPGARQ